MSSNNSTRRGCKDVFHAFLVEGADFAGELEIPRTEYTDAIPERLIPFSKAVSGHDFDAWVHFFEDDSAFERLWNNPNRYLPILQRYRGVIMPDFSLYRDMPLVQQQWNVYRSRAIGHWLYKNGVPVIPNIRFGDERTYELCCCGVPRGGTIAVGSHGCIKITRERECFQRGLAYVVERLQPQTIIVYGTAPDAVFGRYRKAGIRIIQFESDYSVAHSKGVSA